MTEQTMTETVVPTGNPEDERTEEQLVADDFYEALMRYSRESPRSQQAGRFQVGISDLGFCPERTRRMLDGQVPDPVDVLPAFHGTAIGDHAEKAYKALHPEVITQADVTITFRILIDGVPYIVEVPGHPDIIDPAGRMLDVKTDEGLADVERNGASVQQRFQRNLYGMAAFEAGLFSPEVNLEDVQVGNVWIDRSANDRYCHVELEKINLDTIEEARLWLEDVVYHLVNRQEAHKAPPRQMCEKVCGYFGVCRVQDTDVEGLIEDPITVERVRMYVEGRDLASQGERLKRAAKTHLSESGVVPVDDRLFEVRLTWVNPTIVPESTRRGYDKIEVREVKKKGGK